MVNFLTIDKLDLAIYLSGGQPNLLAQLGLRIALPTLQLLDNLNMSDTAVFYLASKSPMKSAAASRIIARRVTF